MVKFISLNSLLKIISEIKFLQLNFITSFFYFTGFQMLQKLGWSEGQGLGSEGSGRIEPINK